MIKRLLLVLALASLLVVAVGGLVYASSHTPINGKKLVGTGFVGPKGEREFSFVCDITNPDCKNKITIRNFVLLDGNRNVVYEGQPLADAMGLPAPPFDINPHQILVLPVESWRFPVGWDFEAKGYEYTLEIAWKAKPATNPLTGWVERRVDYYTDAEHTELVERDTSVIPMVNFGEDEDD